MKNWTDREQKLVDVLFEILLTYHRTKDEYFKEKSAEEIAEWASAQLTKNGFLNLPIGMNWGVLLEDETYNKLKEDDKTT